MKDKIILIGNGFDLAHGLKTSYKDMFDDFFSSLVKVKKDEFGELRHYPIGVKKNTYSTVIGYIADQVFSSENTDEHWLCAIINKESFEYRLDINPTKKEKSIFLKGLLEYKNTRKNWCDIEEFYFNFIKTLKDNESIEIVNQEFEYLKRLLIDYIEKVETNVEEKNILKKSNITNILNQNISEYQNIHFVCFNYTQKILNLIVEDLKGFKKNKLEIHQPIHVHGQINSRTNPVIFGYGDDNSDDYKRIEALGKNEFLKNFKTFQYLRTNKEKSTIGLLNSKNKIDIHVIGHSLGLTDKSLLRTMFKHPNVKNIEIAYHDNDDQYFENIYNASRIIDDNEMVRQKIIDLESVRKKIIKSF